MSGLPVQPVTDVTCSGSPFELGCAQGEALRESIRQSIETLKDLEAVRLMKPACLPYGWFLRLAEARSMRFLQRAFRKVPVTAEERLRGIAAGSGTPLRQLALCCAMEAVLSDLRRATTTPPLGAGCSALAASRSATVDGDALLAHNFDYLPATQPFYFIRRSRPAGKLASVDFTLAPLAGVVTGVNEAGLAVICNYAYAVDEAVPAPTITMLLAEVLAECRDLAAAINLLETTPHCGGGLVMLGDAHGEIASVEISNSRLQVRRPQPDRDRIYHSNQFCCPTMKEVELSAEAHYDHRSPAALCGRRVHQSSDQRDARLARLVGDRERFDRSAVQNVMADHGPDNAPSADTICMHGDYWHTTASLQLLPAARQLRASFSPSCIAEYTEFVV